MGVPHGSESFPEHQIGKCIKHWQHVLNLDHWRVEYEIVDVTKIARALMEITPNRLRHIAMISIRSTTLAQSDPIEFQKLLVHELTHLIYDPIAEEHGFQCLFQQDEERLRESKARFTAALEKCVEHTSYMLCRALPMKAAEWFEDDTDFF